MATVVGVFIQTNHFKEDLMQYDNYCDIKLSSPTDSTIEIVEKATACLNRIYREEYHYKRVWVIVMAMDTAQGIQPDLFEFNAERFEKMKKLDAVIDKINKVNGTETVVLCFQQYQDGKKFADAMKRDMKNKNPATRWNDIILLK